MKDGDTIDILKGIPVKVIGTPGHSSDEISYQINDMVFIGDTIPVKGDIPILVDSENMKMSLSKLEMLSGVSVFYPAWDKYIEAK